MPFKRRKNCTLVSCHGRLGKVVRAEKVPREDRGGLLHGLPRALQLKVLVELIVDGVLRADKGGLERGMRRVEARDPGASLMKKKNQLHRPSSRPSLPARRYDELLPPNLFRGADYPLLPV